MKKIVGVKLSFDDDDWTELECTSGLGLDDIHNFIDEKVKPKAPLIKDEKIRKAVRAWADAWGFDRVYAYGDDHTNTTRFENGNAGVGIEIDDSRIEPLDKRKCYTIAELCGEEKE